MRLCLRIFACTSLPVHPCLYVFACTSCMCILPVHPPPLRKRPRARKGQNSPEVCHFSIKNRVLVHTSGPKRLKLARGPQPPTTPDSPRNPSVARNPSAVRQPDSLRSPRGQYSAPQKNSAFPGTDWPASEREPEAMRPEIHDGSFLPRPTSMSDPTMARTIFLKNLFARIRKTI